MVMDGLGCGWGMVMEAGRAMVMIRVRIMVTGMVEMGRSMVTIGGE